MSGIHDAIDLSAWRGLNDDILQLRPGGASLPRSPLRAFADSAACHQRSKASSSGTRGPLSRGSGGPKRLL